MSRAKKRADRIRAAIPIAQVLADYGYAVNPDAGDHEQQYSCDLHGSGRDNKPSARIYPASNSTYCFGCDKTRDAITFCRDKAGLEFWAAVKYLEKQYRLPELPWDDEDAQQVEESLSDKVREILQKKPTRDEVVERATRYLRNMVKDRDVPLDQILEGYERLDRAIYGLEQEHWPEEKGLASILSILP